MRFVSNGAFNLCPSEFCHPGGGAGRTVWFRLLLRATA
jgi:hypothetical protein